MNAFEQFISDSILLDDAAIKGSVEEAVGLLATQAEKELNDARKRAEEMARHEAGGTRNADDT